MNHHDYTGEIYYPVKIEYPKDRLVPVSPLPQKIGFSATGSGWVILRKSLHLNVTPISIYPLGIPTKKEFTSHDLLPVISSGLPDLKINYLLSDTMLLAFDYLGKKDVVLKLDTGSLSLASDYHIVTPIYIEPDTITISGALSEINKTPNIIYMKLPQQNLKGSYSDDVPLDSFSSHITSSVNSVHIGFGSKHFITYTKSYPLCQLNFPAHIIAPKLDVKVDFIISEDHEETLSSEDLKVCIDYNHMDSASQTVSPVVVNIPSFVKRYTVTPDTIKVYYAE